MRVPWLLLGLTNLRTGAFAEQCKQVCPVLIRVMGIPILVCLPAATPEKVRASLRKEPALEVKCGDPNYLIL